MCGARGSIGVPQLAHVLVCTQYLCTFISAASKFVQLRHLWEMQDSGAVSALTWGLSAYTCAGRQVLLQCRLLAWLPSSCVKATGLGSLAGC